MPGTPRNRLTLNVGVRGDMYQGKGNDRRQRLQQHQLGAAARGRLRRRRRQPDGAEGLRTACYYEGAQTQLFNRALPGVQDYVTYEVVSDGDAIGPEIDRTQAVIRTSGGRHQASARRRNHARIRARAERNDAAVTHRHLARQQELRQLGATVGAVAAGHDHDDDRQARSPSTTGRTVRHRTRTTSIREREGFQYLDSNGNVIGTADPFRKYRAFMAVLNKRLHQPLAGAGLVRPAPMRRATSTTTAPRRWRRGSSRRRTSRW